MPAAKYIVDLSDEEREQLLGFITKKKSSARKFTRARSCSKPMKGSAMKRWCERSTWG